MKWMLPGALLAAVALFGTSAPTFAHHGFGVEFDASKCMDLKGTLTDIDWENPHAYVHLDVKGTDGKTEPWRLEMITPNALKRNGTTRQDFLSNMGKPMAARACPAKAGGTQYRGAAEFIELADGQIRVTGQLVEKITPDKFHF
jgi:hypothetical protein